MNKQESLALLREHLHGYRCRSYHDLVGLLGRSQGTTEIRGASGVLYQITVVIHWDDKPQGALRVIGSIDDRGWRAFMPVTEDFIFAPDGTFVGE